jgi:DNA-binding PadR family transcriptional regulator
MSSRATRPPDALLPLPPAFVHILLALADQERHGYAIMREIRRLTDGDVVMGPGTLYGAVKRMLEFGLIDESDERPDPELDDERRRYYRITPFGSAVARAEARRLTQMIKLARACGIAPERA